MAKKRTKTKSKTKTITKNKPSFSVVSMGECTDSFSKIVSKKLPKSLKASLKAAPLNYTNENGGGQVAIADGEQRTATLFNFLTNGDLDTLATAANQTGNAGIMAYLGGKAQLMITNHGSSTCRFLLYVVRTKRDSNGSANDKYLEGIDDTGGSATSYTDFGARPAMSYEFRLFKKVHKVVAFCLAPGQTHVHHLDYKVKKLWNPGLSTQSDQTYLKGWTVEIMLISHGVAAVDSVGANATTADGQYNYVWSKQHKLKSIAAADAKTTFTVALPTKNTITTRLYNTDTSAVGNVDVGD